MRALSSLAPDEARRLRGLLFDLDDTLLSHGVLTRVAYDALWMLKDAGLALVAVTGRPSGWGEVLVRQWPIDGCVTENGAVHVVRTGRRVVRLDACDEATRRERTARLARLVARVREVVPEARLSDDAHARVSDVTWDVGELVTLPRDRIDLVVREYQGSARRAHHPVSTFVHLHATFDVDDKATGAVPLSSRAAARGGSGSGRRFVRFAFAGDSSNDAPCFAAFRLTFGVANVRASIRALPA